MSRVLTLVKRAVKAVLRPLADALLASSRSLPARVEACLAESPAVADRVEKHLATSDSLAGRIEECLAASPAVGARVEEYLAGSETLAWRIEVCLTGSPRVQARLEDLVVQAPALPARVEECLAGSAALTAQLERWLEQSKTFRARVEQWLATSDLLPRRVEECVTHFGGLAGLIEKHVLNSAALGGRVAQYLAASPALPTRFEEHVRNSPALASRLEGFLATSESVGWQIEQHLAASEALPGRVEECLVTSLALPARVEECLITSQTLPRRVEECVRDLRSLADRIEECLWTSKALPRRIDDALGGSPAIPDRVVEECLRRSSVLPQAVTDLLPDNPCLAAVVVPYQDEYPAAVPRGPRRAGGSRDVGELPVPPRELWDGYGPAASDYVAGGTAHAAALRDLLRAAGTPAESLGRILDFTCGAGRVLRGLADLAGDREVWGVDVSAPHVVWLRQHLCPPLRAVTRTTSPHLPFEDRFFGLVYSTAPFGRPPDLADAWLLELKRVLQPGGRLCLAVLDKQAVERLLESRAQDGPEALLRAGLSAEPNRALLRSDYTSLAVQTPLGVHVLYDRDDLCEQWGRELRVVSVPPAAWGPYTAALLERP